MGDLATDRLREIERLKAALDQMEQDWSDDNKAHLNEIERLKAERDDLKKDNDVLNKRVSDMERGDP